MLVLFAREPTIELRFEMATYTPPPYFPQSSLAPPDKNRYRKFKVIVALLAVGLVILLGAIGYGLWQLVRWAL